MGSVLVSAPKILDRSVNQAVFYPPNTDQRVLLSDQLPENEELFWVPSTMGHRVCGLHIKPPKGVKRARYQVWAHGTNADIVWMRPYVQQLAQRLKQGVILFDYQGYGLSEGEPNEYRCYDDMDAVMRYVLDYLRIDPSRILLVGRSLGTGIVIQWAEQHEWTYPIVLISAYASVAAVYTQTDLGKALDRFKSVERVGRLRCPVQLIHGGKDNVIHVKHIELLWQALPRDQVVSPLPYIIPEADHMNILDVLPIHVFRASTRNMRS